MYKNLNFIFTIGNFRLKMKRFILKPFWSFEVFALVQIPIWLFFSLKSKSLAFLAIVNPNINFGGFLNYSKYELLKHLDKKFLPKTIIFKETDNLNMEKIKILLFENNMAFPLIIKPDIGERGDKVFKVKDILEMKEKLRYFLKQDILIQEFIDYPLEIGVLYAKFPNATKGSITSFALKIYATVVGDGKSTVKELILNKKLSLFKITIDEKELNRIPRQYEVVQITEIGNKNCGTRFKNLDYLIDEKLQLLFDEITKNVPYFYFGRYDIKTESIESFLAGSCIKILELNGTNSQPIHMFDEKISVFETYKILFKNWKTMYEISLVNKSIGHKSISNSLFIKQTWFYYKMKKKSKAKITYP